MVDSRNGARTYGRRIARPAAAVVLALATLAAGCGKGDFEKTDDGFNIEPAAEPGPHAFTASVAKEDRKGGQGAAPVDGAEMAQAGDTSACDNEAFIDELQKRPEAMKEWARVLGIPQGQVPAYIRTLTSDVLTSDTKITNHGLKNGKAYPRASVLVAGTAVFVDTSGGKGSKSTTTTEFPPATSPNGGVIVTRCKCGNPLLPPRDPKEVEAEAEAIESSPDTGTTEPGTVPPASRTTGTSSGATTTRAASTTTRSTTATTRAGATTTEPS